MSTETHLRRRLSSESGFDGRRTLERPRSGQPPEGISAPPFSSSSPGFLGRPRLPARWGGVSAGVGCCVPSFLAVMVLRASLETPLALI